MDKKKEIGNAFKERLGDLNKMPSDAVWDRISKNLPDKKDKDRVLPLWIKLSGIAATIAFLVFVTNNYYSENTISNDTIFVTTDDQVIEEQKNTIDENQIEEHQGLNENDNVKITINDNNKKENEINESLKDKTHLKHDTNFSNNKQLINQSQQTETAVSEKLKVNDVLNTEEKKDAIVLNSNKDKGENSPTVVVSKKGEVATTKIKINETDKNKDLLFQKKDEIGIADVKPENRLNDSISNKVDTAVAIEMGKETLGFDEIKDEPIKEESQLKNKWSISPMVAPVFYNSFNSGSSINSLSDQSNSSAVSYSYGVQVGYAISEKITLTSGLNKLDVTYNASSINVPALSQSTTGESISAIDITSNNLETQGLDINAITLNDVSSFDQSISYFEVPLHLRYQLLDNNFSFSLLGGGSAYVLDDDEIQLDLNSGASVSGAANNIKNISYSLNLGMGIGYQVSKSLQFTVDPLFKAKLNTYSSNSDFKPYIFGVYTGFNFKF